MTARVTSAVLVSALLRRTGAAGGHAALIVRGEPSAGAILLICMEKGEFRSLLERVSTLDGEMRWAQCGPDQPADFAAVTAYLERRRARDPDLWVVELDIAGAERFAAETTGLD